METTAADVQHLFERSAHAQAEYRRWVHDETRRGVHAVALGHVSRHVYAVTPLQVRQLAGRISEDSDWRFPRGGTAPARRDFDVLHPLGRILTSAAQDHRARNWSPPMSFNLAFHVLLERRMGQLFTIQEFRAACGDDKQVLWPLLGHSGEEWRERVKRSAPPPEYERFLDGMAWRVGCAYYAFLKEVYILASVREKGLDLRMHPLVDTLFRMDFWSARRQALSLYVPNKLYASDDGESGRKPPMENFIEDLFSYRRFELPVPKLFGTVELPQSGVIAAIAEWLRE